MPSRLSTFLKVRRSALAKHGVFDALIGIDSRLFLDPLLLKRLKIPELKDSRKHFEDYFQRILLLLTHSKQRSDIAWREAERRLVFGETQGVSLGYGMSTGDGSGIGPTLGRRLLQTAFEIVQIGITDPAIFELLGLFEKDFGPDRLSDMTISIIQSDLFRYTSRVAQNLGLRKLVRVRTPHGRYKLPKGPDPRKPLVFVPRKVLRRLPVAQSWDEISDVVWFNDALRRKLNAIISRYWEKGLVVLKEHLRSTFLGNPKELRQLLKGYKKYHGKPYDVLSDPQGMLSWFELGTTYAKKYPLALHLLREPTLDEIQGIVETIIGQFTSLIENNGLNIHLYDAGGKPLHERYSQRLFFSVADSYCKANNIELSPEPNAGSGPVDFKFSRGYHYRVLTEIKLSSNKQVVHGYEKQLPTYEKSEKTDRSAYVIIRVAKSQSSIKRVNRLHDAAVQSGEKVPKVFVIDGRRKPSASKR